MGCKVKTAAQTFFEDKAFDSAESQGQLRIRKRARYCGTKSSNSLNGDESGNLDYILPIRWFGRMYWMLVIGINAAESTLFAADHSVGQTNTGMPTARQKIDL